MAPEAPALDIRALEVRAETRSAAKAHDDALEAWAEAYGRVRLDPAYTSKLIALAGALAKESIRAYERTGDREYLTYGISVVDDCRDLVATRSVDETLQKQAETLATYRGWLVDVGAKPWTPPPEAGPTRAPEPVRVPPTSELPSGAGMIAGGSAITSAGLLTGLGALYAYEPEWSIPLGVASVACLGGGITLLVFGGRRAKHRRRVIRRLRGIGFAPDLDGGGTLVVHGRF